MKCEEINEFLAAYLDKEVTHEEQSQIKAHLAACGECREELRVLASEQEGLRQVLRAKAAEAEPPPQVWNVVSQRITSRSHFREQFSGILSRPVWRAVMPITLIVVLAFGILWGTEIIPGLFGTKEPSTPTPTVPGVLTTPTIPTTPGLPPKIILGMKIAPHKTVYSFGDPIVFEISIINVSPDAMMFGPNPPTTQIMLPGGVSGQAPEPEIVATSAPGSGEVKLEPGEKVTYSVIWDQRNSHGQQVPPGPYFPNIKARDISIDGEAGTRIGGAFGILIQPPSEIGERILEVNQSRNVEGNVFTLERIELKSTEMDIYASVKGADSSVTIYVVSAQAEYSIDGGPRKEAGSSEILHNVLHIWKSLAPVPSDARELTFIITRFGNMEGHWEFKIPLK